MTDVRLDLTSLQTLMSEADPSIRVDVTSLQSIYTTTPSVRIDQTSIQILRSVAVYNPVDPIYPAIRHGIYFDNAADDAIFRSIVPLPDGHPDKP